MKAVSIAEAAFIAYTDKTKKAISSVNEICKYT